MLSFSGSLKVFVALEACDMRKGFNGLHALVTQRLRPTPITCWRLKATKARPLQRLRSFWMRPLSGRTKIWVLWRRPTKAMAGWKPADTGRVERLTGLPIATNGKICGAWEWWNRFGEIGRPRSVERRYYLSSLPVEIDRNLCQSRSRPLVNRKPTALGAGCSFPRRSKSRPEQACSSKMRGWFLVLYFLLS
jgi:transposase